jgi:hypothetical protein
MKVIEFIFGMIDGIILLFVAFGVLVSTIYMLYNVLLKQVLLNKEIPLKTKIIETIIVILIILGGCGYFNVLSN